MEANIDRATNMGHLVYVCFQFPLTSNAIALKLSSPLPLPPGWHFERAVEYEKEYRME